MTVVQHDLTFQEIMDLHPDGVLLCNGPGDPAKLQQVVETCRGLLKLAYRSLESAWAISFWHGLSGPRPAC